MALQVHLHKRGLKRVLRQHLIVQESAQVVVELALVSLDQRFEHRRAAGQPVFEQQFFVGHAIDVGR